MVLLTTLIVATLPGGYAGEVKSVFWLGSIAIIFQGLYTSMNAWFQYEEKYWYSSVATIGGTLLGTGLTYYYAVHSPSLSHFLGATTWGYVVMALCSMYLGRSMFSLTVSPARIKRLLKASLTLGAILLASVLASKLDTIILGVYRSASEVGEYGFAYRIFDVLLVFPVFIMNAVYPRLVKGTSAQAHKLIRRSLPFMGALGLLLAVVSWIFSPWMLFIRPELTLSVSVLKTLSLSIPLFFVTAPLMWHLVSQRREKIVLAIYCAAALLNGLLNLTFIPASGPLAAAAITGFTELFILGALLYHSHYASTT
jgi:O-antigen/teichoic acid export membrane protein